MITRWNYAKNKAVMVCDDCRIEKPLSQAEGLTFLCDDCHKQRKKDRQIFAMMS